MTREVFFIHLPKCAGISVREACPGVISDWHADCNHYAETYGERWRMGFKFTIVRHPFDRAVSAFSYLKQQTPSHRFWVEDMGRRKIMEPYRDVNEFIAAGNHIARQVLHFWPQYTWLTDWLPDLILHFERLDEEWRMLWSLFPYFGHLGKINTSRHKDYREVLTAKSQETLRQWYAEDLRLFGYTDR
jgi:hypothetical protein